MHWEVLVGHRLLRVIITLATLACTTIGRAQQIIGTPTVDIDPDTGNVSIVCETDLDDDAAAFYSATVSCSVSVNGVFLQNKIGKSTRGNPGTAVAFINIASNPGSTYTAIGTHGGTIVYFDENASNPQQMFYSDFYNFAAFGNYGDASNQEAYPDSFNWLGPGSPSDETTVSLTTGRTTDSATTDQIPTSLKLLSATVLPTGIRNTSGCTPANDFGIKLDIEYKVTDQVGKPILKSGMTPIEAVQFATGGLNIANIGPTANPNSSLTTASDGTFHDVPFGFRASGAFSNANQLQIIYIDSTSTKVRQNSFIVNSTAAGKGTITNSIDISRSR